MIFLQVVRRGFCCIYYTSGIVRDTNTGLEWLAGPGRDKTWGEARLLGGESYGCWPRLAHTHKKGTEDTLSKRRRYSQHAPIIENYRMVGMVGRDKRGGVGVRQKMLFLDGH